MIAVITGDIIGSSRQSPETWLTVLKEILNKIGQPPKDWEIYRGDSFQLIVHDPNKALLSSILIKAAIKTIRNLDVRMAIGIGEIDYSSQRVTESNGSAFVNSGEKFESLKKEKVTLAIQTEWKEFDRDINLFLKLALLTMDNWTVNAAEIIMLALENPEKSQAQLGKLIGIKQNAVSSRLKRAAFEEIMEIVATYQAKLKAKL